MSQVIGPIQWGPTAGREDCLVKSQNVVKGSIASLSDYDFGIYNHYTLTVSGNAGGMVRILGVGYNTESTVKEGQWVPSYEEEISLEGSSVQSKIAWSRVLSIEALEDTSNLTVGLSADSIGFVGPILLDRNRSYFNASWQVNFFGDFSDAKMSVSLLKSIFPAQNPGTQGELLEKNLFYIPPKTDDVDKAITEDSVLEIPVCVQNLMIVVGQNPDVSTSPEAWCVLGVFQQGIT
jgi:hypothetical protein